MDTCSMARYDSSHYRTAVLALQEASRAYGVNKQGHREICSLSDPVSLYSPIVVTC